jgi:hypothetical protein
MSFLVPKPDAPAAPPPPPNPYADGQSPDELAAKKRAQDAMDAAATQQRKLGGRAATLLTGGQGDTSSANVSRRILLGN